MYIVYTGDAVIGRKNETGQEVFQIIWDIPNILSAINCACFESSNQLESCLGMFQM